MTQRFTDARTASLRFTPEGFLHLRWNTGVAIAEADARSAVELVNQMCSGRRWPLLIDTAGAGSLDREARTVFTRRACASKIALVVGSSPTSRVLANIFLRLEAPPCPTRFFTSRARAIRWLRQH